MLGVTSASADASGTTAGVLLSQPTHEQYGCRVALKAYVTNSILKLLLHKVVSMLSAGVMSLVCNYTHG